MVPTLAPNEVFLGKVTHLDLGAIGAVAATRDDELVVAALRGDGLHPFPAPSEGGSTVPIALVSGSPSAAYWISRGRLVRRKILTDGTVQELEVLTRDAADGTRLSAGRSLGPSDADVVLYIGGKVSKELERSPRLWVEKHGARPISSDAGGATSVHLVGLGGSKFALLTLDGRVAMSPVHAVSLELDAAGSPHLGEDRVVYVAGPAERHTAISGIQIGVGPVGLLPISKDTTQFGLLSLLIGYGDSEAPSSWVDYPNGLDPAPAEGIMLCGSPRVLYVRPESAAAGAPRVLEIARLGADGKVTDPRVIAKGRTMRSLASWAPGAGTLPRAPSDKTPAGWVGYVTDVGVIAQPLTCD